MVGGTKIKSTLGVERKGQQMSFRMTHDSFGPWRDSTVCVSLPCGSIVRHGNEANPIVGRNVPLKAG